MMAILFRLIELSSGSISIDGVDISNLALRQLRSRISIIPQEALLFSGTIRTNLDPFSEHEDKDLWDALRRAHVSVESHDEKHSEPSSGSRFTLDTLVDAEGANLSVGASLCRWEVLPHKGENSQLRNASRILTIFRRTIVVKPGSCSL